MDFCARLMETFLFLRCLCGITSAERFIIRQQANKFGDVFKFSSKLKCGKDFCSRYKATSISQSNNCTCQCKTKPNLTFGLTDRKWKCLDDRVIRAKEGCSIFMENNNLQSNLLTLSDGHKKELNIDTFPNLSNPCYISHETSYYLTCNGTWEKIGQPVFQRFFLFPSDKTPWKLEIKVKIATPATKYLNGRVIKIGFTSGCTLIRSTGTTSTQLCLLFKLKGSRICPTSKPTIPSTLTKYSSTKAHTGPNSFSKPTVPTTLTTQSSTKAHIAMMTNETLPMSHFPASAIPTTVTSSNSLTTVSGKTAYNKEETRRTKIIVIAVTTNAVFIAIIAVLVLLLYCMKKRQSRKPNTKDEEPYAEIPVGEDSIPVGNHAYARLNTTKKKKNTSQRAELGEMKNFPNPSFDDFPNEISLPAPSNEPKDESFSYASLYDNVRRNSKGRKQKGSIDSGVHSDAIFLEDLASASPITNTVSSPNQQKDLVYSYAIPDHIPGGNCLLTRLPRPNADTNSERRHSVTSASFSYDYVLPESPKKVQEVRDKDSQPSNSKMYANISTENHNSESKKMSRDSVRNNNSGSYYNISDNQSIQSGTGNDSSTPVARVPRPNADTNSERRHSVASSSFSYDYALPESPKKVQEVRDKDSQPSNSTIYANLSTENHNPSLQ